MAETLFVTVRTRQNVLFEGEAKALTSYNERGVFDILPAHANFITLVTQALIIYTREGVKREFPIEKGILEVEEDKVVIYLGVGTPQAT